MAIDQVPEQNCTKVFLVDLDSQAPVTVFFKAGDFGKASAFPVLLKCLLHEKPLFKDSGPVLSIPL